MKAPLMFSAKRSLVSRLFVAAVIVSIVVPQTFAISLSVALADEEAASTDSQPAETSERTPEAATPAISVTADESDHTVRNLVVSDVTPVTDTTEVGSTDTDTDTTANPTDTVTPATEGNGSTPTSGGSSGGNPQAPESQQLGAPNTGTIMVCMVLLDDHGQFVDHSGPNTPHANFSMTLMPGTNPPTFTETAEFDSAHYQKNWPVTPSDPHGAYDAQCVTYNNLPFDPAGYIYEEEVITGRDAGYFIVPRYNDGDTLQPNRTQNFFHYGHGIYGDDQIPGLSDNVNSDGHIVLNAQHPMRMVYILNQYNTFVAPTSCTSANGTSLSPAEFINARDAGLVTYSWSPLGPSSDADHIIIDSAATAATFHITNNTGCTIPLGMGSYKVFSQTEPQEVNDIVEHVDVGPSADLTVRVPNCMAQLDVFFNHADRVLLPYGPNGENPYVYPGAQGNFIFTAGFYFPTNGTWGDLPADYCAHGPANTPPTITLVGSNPIVLLDGSPFVDPGATAHDAEDGDLTSHIVVTGTVDSNVIGSYVVTYTVTDSGGLSASVSRTVIVANQNIYLPQMPVCSGNFGTVTGVSDASPAGYDTGYHRDNVPEHWVLDAGRLDSGDSLDSYWIHIYDEDNYATWDLNSMATKLRTYPAMDHGPYPQEFDEYAVQVSADGTTWTTPSIVATYVDDINNVRVHDGARDFSSATPFRYVRISPSGTAGDDYEMDAIQACNTPNTPPTITVLGDNPMTVFVHTTFTDPGATAHDAEDGDLTNHIVTTGTVDADTLGTYTITYTVTDSGGLTTSATRTVNVVENNGGGGNPPDDNGGGGSRRHGQRRSSGGQGGEILGAETGPTACFYLKDYLRRDWNNDQTEVLKLQYFLKYFEGETNLAATGVFDQATYDAVSRFQNKYFDDILKPWGHTAPTGFVYILTKKKVNEIFCQTAFPVNAQQQEEIDNFRAFLQGLKDRGITVPSSSGDSMMMEDGHMENIDNMVGVGTSTSPISSSFGNVIKDKIDTKNLRAVAAAIFSVPKDRETILQSIYFLLIAIIAIYLFTEIIVGSRDSSKLTKYQIWSRKATGYLIGLIIAIIAAVWYQVFSIVVPLLVLAIASGVFLIWSMTKKTEGEVINLPPTNR